MKNKIYYSKEALRDLDEIWDYIATEFQNLPAAEKIVGRIMNAVDKLGDFAEIGAPLSAIVDVKNDYRMLVSGKYLIFYRVQEEKVYIDRIMYGRRDYLNILFEDIIRSGEEEE